MSFSSWYLNEYLKAAHPNGLPYGYASIAHIHIPLPRAAGTSAAAAAAEAAAGDIQAAATEGEDELEAAGDSDPSAASGEAGDGPLAATAAAAAAAAAALEEETATQPALQLFVPLLRQARSYRLSTLGLEIASSSTAAAGAGAAAANTAAAPAAAAAAADAGDSNAGKNVTAAIGADAAYGGDTCIRWVRVRRLPSAASSEGSQEPLQQKQQQVQQQQVQQQQVQQQQQGRCAVLPVDAETAELLLGPPGPLSGVPEGGETILHLFEDIRVLLVPGERQWALRLSFDS